MTEEIIERLRSLDLSGGSHSRLSAIASCFLEPAFGWTRGACEELRNMLINTLEGKDGNDANDYAHDCSCTNHRCDQHGRQVSYDELVNERNKAVCELRNVQMDTGNAIKKLAVALGLEWNPNNAPKSVALLQNRIIHLLGGDECNFSGVESYMDATGEKSNPAETSDASTDHVSFDTRLKLKTYAYIILEFADTLGIDYPNGSKITDVAVEVRKRLSVLMSEHKATNLPKSVEIAKPESENGGEITITDELRKWIKSLYTPNSDKLKLEGLRIVDRIDEQFDRICEQQEAVLQSTIDSMCEEQDRLQERLRTAELGCNANHRLSEANARWCDELVDLLRDAAWEYEDKHHWAQFWHNRAEDMRMERDTIETERNRLAKERDNLLDLLRDARDEYKMLDQMSTETSANFHAMRDRVWGLEAERDELQSTIDEMAAELDSARAKNRRLTWHIDQMQGGSRKWREKCEALKAERDELQAKLDDYDKTHVALPKDANGDYWHIGDESEYGEVTGILFNSTRTLIEIRMGNGERNMFGTSLGHKAKPVTVEQVIRDLTMGKITESQAIERIEGINGQG